MQSTDTEELLFLDHPQKLGLHFQGQLRHLIQKQRPALRQIKLSLVPLLRCPAECSGFIAKKLTLEQIGRDRGAVDVDKRAGFSLVAKMYRPRHQFLASTRFPFNHHRQISIFMIFLS